MFKNNEQLNNEAKIIDAFIFVEGGNTQSDVKRQIPIEDLMKCAGLESTLENDQAIYALTNTSECLLSELNFEDQHLFCFSKRIIDVTASAQGMCLLSWLILGTAIAVKVTSSEPIIYNRQRGKNKKLLNIYKFHTMRLNIPNLPTI